VKLFVFLTKGRKGEMTPEMVGVKKYFKIYYKFYFIYFLREFFGKIMLISDGQHFHAPFRLAVGILFLYLAFYHEGTFFWDFFSFLRNFFRK